VFRMVRPSSRALVLRWMTACGVSTPGNRG
jgi:hypothetical protein